MSLLTPGICRVCGCTEFSPCVLVSKETTCGWLDSEHTLCSNPECVGQILAMNPEAGLRAIEEAKALSVSAHVVRLFAVAMCYYRDPVGDLALDEIERLIGQDALTALSFLCGFAAGAGNKGWDRLAFPDPNAAAYHPPTKSGGD